MKSKGLFTYFEMIFDILYLSIAAIIGCIVLWQAVAPLQWLAGIASFILVLGDSFHLLPRIRSIYTKDTKRFQKQLGIGKLITSITMTVFYVFLWHIAIVTFQLQNISFYTIVLYILAILRIALCLFPQNKWTSTSPSVAWGIVRNIPFLLQGLMVSTLYFIYRNSIPSLHFMWLAILFSFAFYIPVVLWAHKKRILGMLMLPKTCMYVWILWMFLSL